MKILSVFVDESGMYGSEVSHYAPYYIVTLVLHDQAVDIYDSINEFQRKMAQLGRSETVIHTGRLIRREEEYRDMLLLERKQIFNSRTKTTGNGLSELEYKACIFYKP